MKKYFTLFIVLLSFSIFLISCGEKKVVKKPGEAAKGGSTQQGSQQQNSSSGNNLSSDGKLVLKLNFQKGMSFNLKMKNEQKISQTIEKQTQNVNQSTELNYTFTVEDVDQNGNATVKVTYNSLRQEMQGPAGKIVYDSKNPADKNNPLSKIFNSFAGKDFRMKLTPDGHVLEVTGMDKIIKNILKNIQLPPGANLQAAEQSINQQFGNEQIRETMENTMAIYPDNSVKIGETWSKKINMARTMPMTVDNVWKLTSVKDGMAYIEMTSKIKTSPVKAPAGAPPMKYDVTGTQNGTVQIDESTGWIMKSNINQKINGKIIIEKNAQMPNGATMPVSIEGTTILEASKK